MNPGLLDENHKLYLCATSTLVSCARKPETEKERWGKERDKRRKAQVPRQALKKWKQKNMS